MTDVDRHKIVVSSRLTLSEFQLLMKKLVPEMEIMVLSNDENKITNGSDDSILLKDFSQVQAEMDKRDEKIIDLEATALRTSDAINALYRQQQGLFEEFVTLRKKYDELKESTNKTLWTHCAPHHPELHHIPSVVVSQSVPSVDEGSAETSDAEGHGTVLSEGNYTIAELLGEGQFATVHACSRPTHLPAHCKPHSRGRAHSYSAVRRAGGTFDIPRIVTSNSSKSKSIIVDSSHELNNNIPMAIKLIKKSKITSFHFLRHLSAEIESLERLNGSQHVTRLLDSFQTREHVCLVTERCDGDLFEFLRTQPQGVSEDWARHIAADLVRAVDHCHRHGVCHRDIKAENILVKFDTVTGKCQHLKLCDFGLSCRFEPTEPLREFCGSPGFFDPDMLVERNYFGDKADAWSVGAVLLEAVLGQERFGRLWLPAYDYEVLQDQEKFRDVISQTCANLPAALPFSDEQNDFLLGLLTVDSFARTSLRHAARHSWIKEFMVANAGVASTLTFDIPDETIEEARLSARRDLIPGGDDRGSFAGLLPPIFPPAKTPCVNSARKLMLQLRDDCNDENSPIIIVEQSKATSTKTQNSVN